MALDVPSGLDGTKGYVSEIIVSLAEISARIFAGDLYPTDIGIPPQLYQNHKLEIEVRDLFSESSPIRIW